MHHAQGQTWLCRWQQLATLSVHCVLQTFRKPIGEGSIGKVHLGRWQETDVAIKVLGHVSPQASMGMPQAAPLHSTGHMAALEGDSGGDTSEEEELPSDNSMTMTIKTLEREVSLLTFKQSTKALLHCISHL